MSENVIKYVQNDRICEFQLPTGFAEVTPMQVNNHQWFARRSSIQLPRISKAQYKMITKLFILGGIFQSLMMSAETVTIKLGPYCKWNKRLIEDCISIFEEFLEWEKGSATAMGDLT